MHSTCSHFAVASTGEGRRSSDDDNGGDSPAAADSHPVGQGGEGSPEGDIIADARPGGKGRVLHHGALLSLVDNNGDNGRGRGGGG